MPHRCQWLMAANDLWLLMAHGCRWLMAANGSLLLVAHGCLWLIAPNGSWLPMARGCPYDWLAPSSACGNCGLILNEVDKKLIFTTVITEDKLNLKNLIVYMFNCMVELNKSARIWNQGYSCCRFPGKWNRRKFLWIWSLSFRMYGNSQGQLGRNSFWYML